MKTIVIEDEGAARRRLENIVSRHPGLTITGSASSGNEAIKLINASQADLLLMDIQLKDMTAFEVLSEIEQDFSGKIIFITAYSQFAVKAFEVFAIDYVLKPFTEDRVYAAIGRTLKKAKKTDQEMYAILESLHFPNKICIPEGRRSHLFDKDQIEWILAKGYHCEVYTVEGDKQLIRILLKNIHQLLPDNFIRVSRSVVLNKNHVSSYKEDKTDTSFTLKSGKAINGKKRYM